MTDVRRHDVDVRGGTLAVHEWPGDGPLVLAVHGITANGLAWGPVAEKLDGAVTLVAPDLRGRGSSGTLPAPYGMKAHVEDLLAVLDAMGADRPCVVGHSMGAYVVCNLAVAAPDRVRELVLVDGGLSFPVPAEADIDALLDVVIGPAAQRLSMTFPSRQAYREFWLAHPGLGPYWSDWTDRYLQHDLVGEEPEMHSSCSLEAVRVDGAEVLVGPAAEAVRGLPCPAVLLWAERGLMNEPQGLYDEARLAGLGPPVPAKPVPDTNHYTVLIVDHGAEAVAAEILRAAGVG